MVCVVIYQAGSTRKYPVDVGAFEYQLVFQKHVTDQGEALYGQHNPETIELHVDSTQPLQRQVAATLHEAMHAMNHQSHNELSEAQVTVLSLQVMGFMRDNPKLIAAMMEALDA